MSRFSRLQRESSEIYPGSESDGYKSKNLVTERNRRTRIKNGLFSLSALVPKISKMDKAAILGDAIDYIGELIKDVKNLRDEIKNAEKEECRASNMELKTSKLETCQKGCMSSTKVQLEVDQIGKRHFLLKFLCEKKRGGFGRLMETIHSLGLQIHDANITTFNGKFLNILKIES